MKVILINGSPHQKGCTFTALSEVAYTLKKDGIEADFFWIGNKPLNGCISCGTCATKKQCVFDDKVNEFLNLAADYDGFIFGSPVHYAAAAGVVSARRAGTTAAYDQLNKYFAITQMPIISSQYWNMVHGRTPEDVRKDIEGLQIMRTLGRNMAFFLKCKEAGLKYGVALPEQEETIHTNFIQ